tara:strand:+ start:422 stop:847 length:426 start_codon:yes stop_codon:yes gene_type:complete
MESKKVITKSYLETMKLGKEVAAYFSPGDVVCLEGDLGVGKTTFMKGFMQYFGYTKTVNSPTFTIINIYDSDPVVVHVDGYREDFARNWINIGVNEYLYSQEVITCIEWPNRISDLLPGDEKYIRFKHLSENKREIYIFEK